MESLSCEVCGNADETPKHIVNGCAIVASFWVAIGVDQMGHPSHVPKDEFGMFITLCYWQLWKRRNDMVFWGEALCSSFVQEWGRSLVMSVAGDKESTHRQMVFSLWFSDVNPSMSSFCSKPQNLLQYVGDLVLTKFPFCKDDTPNKGKFQLIDESRGAIYHYDCVYEHNCQLISCTFNDMWIVFFFWLIRNQRKWSSWLSKVTFANFPTKIMACL